MESQSRPNETGVEELRRIAKATEMCRESCFDGFRAEAVIKMVRACWGSGWEILPDDLLPEERDFASVYGRLPDFAINRLEKELG